MTLDRCAWVNIWQGCLQSHAPDKLAILEGVLVTYVTTLNIFSSYRNCCLGQTYLMLQVHNQDHNFSRYTVAEPCHDPKPTSISQRPASANKQHKHNIT
jgi:hypothetical protein